ncbi:MAG: hypothetical protein ABIL09_07055 [Gemmatimonadota bacterium]
MTAADAARRPCGIRAMKPTLSAADLALLFDPGEERWHRNRQAIKRGYPDLEYLPRTRAGWNATLAAQAFSARLNREGSADLNQWAVMHGCPPSARYAELGRRSLVLWHGTSDERADRIRQVGLAARGGLWTTTEPRIAHGYTRSRSTQFGVGSATVVLVLDREALAEGMHFTQESPAIYRFHGALGREQIEYILWADRIEFRGERRAPEPPAWGRARFKRQGGRYVPLSQPPVRLDDERAYGTLPEWLELSVARILAALGRAQAVEVFSSLYATMEPWDALEHEAVFGVLEGIGPCRVVRGAPEFSLSPA